MLLACITPSLTCFRVRFSVTETLLSRAAKFSILVGGNTQVSRGPQKDAVFSFAGRGGMMVRGMPGRILLIFSFTP